MDMEELREHLRQLSESGSARKQLQTSADFLRLFVQTFCHRAENCPKAGSGECPIDQHCKEGTVIAEISRVGKMLEAVYARLERVEDASNSEKV